MCLAFWKKKQQKSVQTIQTEHPYKLEERSSIVKEETIIIEEVNLDILKVEKKEKLQKYHVSQNKDADAVNYMRWRVRKDSSDKTIQYFDTQKLAIDFAQDLAAKLGTTVVIHKLDGSIRKQDYTRKD